MEFDELVPRYRERVLRLVLSVLGPDLAMDGEDVVQQVFITAHDRMPSFDGEGGVSAWLYRVAFNRAVDHKRKHRRRGRLLSADSPGARNATATAPNAAERMIAAERRQAVREALERLPEAYQTVVRLHYWFGLSVVQIGETLAMPPGTVKSYLYRGRSRLHEILSRKGGAS